MQARAILPPMDWESHAALTTEWREKTLGYVAAINAFVAELFAGKEPDQPEDPRTEELGGKVVEVVRQANAEGAWKELRERVPPAHAPFIPHLEAQAVAIEQVAFVDDETVIARVGAPWKSGVVRVFHPDGASEVLHGVQAAGVSPGGDFVALVFEERCEVRERLDGPALHTFALPHGMEGYPPISPERAEEWEWEPEGCGAIVSVQPFPKGRAVLLAANSGVYVLEESGPRRLFPDAESIAEDDDDDDGEPYTPEFSMLHAAMSPDGKHIACGSQDSAHLVYDRKGKRVARFGPVGSEYPHHAAFSGDRRWAIFNSCHFYNGATCKLRRRHLEGLDEGSYEEFEHLEWLSHGPRVYASAWWAKPGTQGVWLLGDSGGYVLGIDAESSDLVLRHFVGSTIGGIAVSPDGSRLAITTVAGFLVICDLEQDAPAPHQIGWSRDGKHPVERIRFVQWSGEDLWRW